MVLTPVNPFLGDSHKYRFGGKKYQVEFDVDMYDLGARNCPDILSGTPLAGWMNPRFEDLNKLTLGPLKLPILTLLNYISNPRFTRIYSIDKP